MGSTYKRGNTWWISYYRDGIHMRESSGSVSQAEAKRLLSLKESDIAKGIPVTPRMGQIRFSEMAADEINDYRINGRRSVKDVETRFEKHILPFFGEARASAITTADIRRYVVRRQEEGAANGTINRELTAIKRAFSLAAQAGKIMTKPHVPMLKENNVRKGFFDLEQFEAVRKRLSPDVQPMVTFAYITGWRIRSEVRFLQWSQVDFRSASCASSLARRRTTRRGCFPSPESCARSWSTRRTEAGVLRKRGIICPWVFHRGGKPIKEFRRSWKTACKAAGVPGKIPHDFRRTAVRNLVRAGIPEAVAMKMTGHKTRSVFERYNIVSEGDLFDAARKLDSMPYAQFQTQSADSRNC